MPVIAYGVGKPDAVRFGLPCGGNLRLVQEPLRDVAWIDEVLARTERHELVNWRCAPGRCPGTHELRGHHARLNAVCHFRGSGDSDSD